MSIVTTPTTCDPPELTYVTSWRFRAAALVATGLCCTWVLITGYLWLTGEARWIYFLGALLSALCALTSAYNSLTSKLVLSPDGIHYQVNGASYFAGWDNIKQFSTRRWLWAIIYSLRLSQPIQPKIDTVIGHLILPRPISYIPLRGFAQPIHQWRADIARYAPNLLAGGPGSLPK